MEESIFTKIIKGELPCHKIYEDEHTFAFLDIYSNEEGHTLVVLKKQIDKIYDLDDDDYTHLWLVAKKIAKHYEEVLGKRVFFKVIGVDVPHAHIHIIPYDPKSHEAQDEHGAVDTTKEPDHEALSKLAENLRIS